MVFASDDVRDFHFDVVDDIDEMKDPRSVRTPNRHVRICAAVKFDPAANKVIHDHRFSRRPETNGALIHVNDTFCLEQVQVFLVDRITLALKIGPVVAANPGAFVPIEAKPAQAHHKSLAPLRLALGSYQYPLSSTETFLGCAGRKAN